MSYPKRFLAMLTIGALSACGGGGNNAANTAASAAASAAAAAPSAVASAAAGAEQAAGSAMTDAGNAMASAGNSMKDQGKWLAKTAAPIPADLNCGAVKPVWVNTRTHKYHDASDPMYGKTKLGKYMCPSAAKAEGDTPAGMMGKHHHKG